MCELTGLDLIPHFIIYEDLNQAPEDMTFAGILSLCYGFDIDLKIFSSSVYSDVGTMRPVRIL